MTTAKTMMTVAIGFGIALTATSLTGLIGCSPSAPGVDDCSNLREIHASGSVDGEFGSLGDYDFSFSGEGEYDVIPPDASDCAKDIAARLEAACRICDKDADSCESTVEQVLNASTQACSTCGDDTCGGDETPANCPQDCADSCGNDVCEGTESVQSCPRDCALGGCGDGTCSAGESPINCPEDCGRPCGNGVCDLSEDVQSCPEDCTVPCGNGTCEVGENPTNCPIDCGTACGDGECNPGESAVLCPEDCGGCVPNRCQCSGNVVVTCNSDGLSSSFRQCGTGNECVDCSCRASNPVAGQTDVETQMLGTWRVTVAIFARTASDRRVELGNAIYHLEVFEVSPPVSDFGVWAWKGALKPDSFCLLPFDDFDAGGGSCTAFPDTRMGRCSATSCSDDIEVPAQGTFGTVDNHFELTRDSSTSGDMFHLDAQGYVSINLDVHAEGTITANQVASSTCGAWCDTTVARSGAYEATFGAHLTEDWTISLVKTTP